ncbi:MAG: hypothetical protein GY842_05465 [bacterium]|nr:hypothetical protein [bacterium]
MARLIERWREAKDLEVRATAEAGRRCSRWRCGCMVKRGRTRARSEEITPVIEPALQGIKYAGGGARPIFPGRRTPTFRQAAASALPTIPGYARDRDLMTSCST